MKPLVRSILAVALVLAALTAHADLTGKVVAVADGDTITILDTDNKQHRIRINGIDAPEKSQSFGDKSRRNMADMVAGKEVTADCHKTDRYGRQICKVWVQPADCPTCGKTLDVGQAQIVVGLAWWYREYAKEQTAEDRGRYESEEHDAKARKRGLWVDKEPVPPWDWRRGPKTLPSQESQLQQSAQTVTKDDFFQNLKRPTSPNNWLIAPADFVIKPDAVAPVFSMPVSGLRQAFKSTILQSKDIVVAAESENAMHLVATTRLMRFQDDIRVLFIPVASDKSTLALYSSSRVGYWDMGTNRRRVEDWIKLTGNTLANAKR